MTGSWAGRVNLWSSAKAAIVDSFALLTASHWQTLGKHNEDQWFSNEEETPMERIRISGVGNIAYDLLGPEGAPAIALTTGGRFAMDTPGLRELGEELAKGGKRVLLWDRPNCGWSDVCFDAENESEMNAQTLVKLITELNLGPTALAGGSAGSRVSLIAAARAPEQISHLIIWWISGGPVGLAFLAHYYCGESAHAANEGGMEAVVNLPGWADQMQKNPGNRDIFLAQDPEKFVETMQRWAASYFPFPDSPVPCMTRDDFGKVTMPTLVLRSGKSDLSHTRRTSEWVHELIPHSELVEPPWGDTEWNERVAAQAETGGLFVRWPLLAPQILEFMDR